MSKVIVYSVVLFNIVQAFIERDTGSIQHFSSDKEPASRIANGSASNLLPYQAFISSATLTETRICSGALISQNYILTAAQCIDTAVLIEIWLGTNNLVSEKDSFQKVDSINYTIHENYNLSTLEYNIGVISVSKVNISEAVNIVMLPSLTETDVSYEDEIVTVSGWGQFNETNTTSDSLLIANTTVVPGLICWETFGYFFDYEMCTLAESGACNGDIGAPIVLNNTLIGVVSHVKDTCEAGYIPNISIRVGAFLDWIQNNTDIVIR